MRTHKLTYIITFILLLVASSAQAQLKKMAEELLKTDNTQAADSTKALAQDSIRKSDSLLIIELQQQVQELKLNEILLNSKLTDESSLSKVSDSIKQAKQRARIDSLRNQIEGVPLVIDGDTLFTLYSRNGGLTMADRVARAHTMIMELGESRKTKPDSTKLVRSDEMTDITNDGKIIISVTDQDALWMNANRDSLATAYRDMIVVELVKIQKQNSLLELLKRVGMFIAVIVGQVLMFKLVNYFFRRIKKLIIKISKTKLKSISFKNYEFLNVSRQARILAFLANMVRYAILITLLLLTIPMLFSIFPQTEDLAMTLFSYILSPIKGIFSSIISYIPNLFTIAVIWLAIKYVVKGIRYVALEVASERLKIPGFYADWAMPSFSIIRFLMYAFMIAMVYPYLPGSSSGVFQGISVFVGIIVSLGSSSVIGNIVAGLVLTYMRPFKIGDRIKLNDIVGNVIEKTPFVTRIRTPKNEIFTIPNANVMNNQSLNYTKSADDYGLIIHVEVGIGYDVPWQKVHQTLIDAALRVDGVLKDPKPFVLELELADLYPLCQINAYIKEVNRYSTIYSDLITSIQDAFAGENIDIASPVFHEMYNPESSIVSRQKKFTQDGKIGYNSKLK